MLLANMTEEHMKSTAWLLLQDEGNALHQLLDFIFLEQVRVPRSELCTVCRRRAYPMDALIVDKKKFHKSCFCCEHCRNKLR